MSNIGNLNIKVGFDGSAATKGLADLTGELGKFGNDAEKHFAKFQQLGEMIGKLGSGGGFSLAALTGVAAAIGKVVGDAGKLAIQFEKANHSAETLKASLEGIAQKDLEWKGMGSLGKATSLPGEAYDSLTGGIGHAIKSLTEFADHLLGLGDALDGLRNRLGEVGSGQAGPISGLLDALGGPLKAFNDWSDKLVGAKTLDEQRADRAAQADVIAREKAAGRERQAFEQGMESLRKGLQESTQTAEEKVAAEAQKLLKIQQDIFSRRDGRQFLDVAMLAEKRRQQILQEQADKQAELARKQEEEQQKIIDAQKRLAEEAAAAAKRLADELENLVSSVRTQSESFYTNLSSLQTSLAEAMASGDLLKTEVYQRKIGQLGAGILANVPATIEQKNSFNASLAGSQEAWRDILASTAPDPIERSVQERLSEGIDEMNRKSEEDLQIQREIFRILSGQGAARVAHLVP